MADRQFPLSIILRTVDNATAGIQAVNKRLAVLTKPMNDLKAAAGDLRGHLGTLGLDAVKGGFAGVGSAVKDLLGKFLVVGGAAAGVVVAFSSMVASFDDMGDMADRLGTTVDFLASMRYAAEKSGASVEDLDGGLQSFSENLGKARTGTGKMAKFLGAISPVLYAQVRASKTTEGAFMLLADAMVKIEDPAKRATFAAQTLGNASLVPLLRRGSKGIGELQVDFINLAGSQKGAAEAAGAVDDSMNDLKAATQGIKAALVQGLAPALGIVVEKLKDWLVGHREDIKQWAEDIGKKLPKAIDDVIAAVKKAVGFVTGFVDGIGGLKAVAVICAAVLVGPLLSAFVTLGVAMLATPFGAVLVSLAAISALVISVTGEIQKMSDAMDTSHEKMLEDAFTLPEGEFAKRHPETFKDTTAFDNISALLGNAPGPTAMFDLPRQPSMVMAPASDLRSFDDHAARVIGGASTPAAETRITVDFMNAPKGTRVATDPQSTATVDLSVGYQMLGAGS